MITYVFSTLNRYFCKQFSFWFLTTTSFIMIVVSLFEFIELLRRSMGKFDVGATLLLEMVILKIPHHIQTLLPFILFFSAVLTIWRLNQTQELLACRTMGTSLWQFIAGLCLVPFLTGFFYLTVLNPISAAMTARLYQLEESVFKNTMGRLSILENGLWFRESIDSKTTIFHSKDYHIPSNTFTDITIYLFDEQNQYAGRVDAPEASLENNQWVLKNADFWNHLNQLSHHTTFHVETSLTIRKVREGYLEPNLISFWQTPFYIKHLKENGLSTTRFILYWHGQLAKVGLMLAMVLLAATFSIHHVRYHNIARLILFGVLAGFLIHFTNDIVYALGLAQKIPIFLAAWLPSLATTMFSVSILLHLEDGRS